MQRWGLVLVAGCAALLCAAPASAATIQGDFDDDGFDDLAIGVVQQTVGGQAGAGAVHVIYGARNGLSGRDRIFTQGTPKLKSEVGPDNFGTALAAGDFDGDGFGDLAIGTPFEDEYQSQNGGIVQILYGSKTGLKVKRNQLWRLGGKGLPNPAGIYPAWGWSLAAADFGRGKQDDLAIGATGTTVDGATAAGSVDVLYGTPKGLSGKGQRRFTQASPGVQDDPESNDAFGLQLASGDFGKDGHADLAVGTAFESVGPAGAAGIVTVLYGGGKGIRSNGSVYLDQEVLHENTDGGIEGGERFGAAMAAGDIGGDGHDDLAIGSPFEEVSSVAPEDISNAGIVSVAYGSGNGLKTNNAAFVSSVLSDEANSIATDQQFGRGIVIANFNGKGKEDLAVGMPGRAPLGGGPSSGEVAVALCTQADGPLSGNASYWSQNTPGVLDASNPQDQLGVFMTAGRFGKAKAAGLAIGVPQEDVELPALARRRGSDPPTATDAGAVTLLYGGPNGIKVAGNRFIYQGHDSLGGTLQPFEAFGAALSGPDSGPVYD